MSVNIEIVMAVFLLSCLLLSACSRMLHCIRIVILQGVLLGILPLLLADAIHTSQYIAAVLNIITKAAVLPFLLCIAMKKANVKRELEPLVSYPVSLLVVLCGIAVAFTLSSRLTLPVSAGESLRLVLPVSFSVMFTGLFIVMARKKAITQAIGFLTFENGIALFSNGMMLECGLAVELGILLDVFVLVFVMGIAVMRINRAFEHIDSDKLVLLGENSGGNDK